MLVRHTCGICANSSQSTTVMGSMSRYALCLGLAIRMLLVAAKSMHLLFHSCPHACFSLSSMLQLWRLYSVGRPAVHPPYAELEVARGSTWRKGKHGRQVWSKYQQVLDEVRLIYGMGLLQVALHCMTNASLRNVLWVK